MKLTVSFLTVGCKLNQSDTERLKQRFRQAGFEILPFGHVVDVSVVNTCTVTSKADYRSRQALRRATKSTKGLVVATGCYAQIDPDDLARIRGVHLVVGTRSRGNLSRLVQERLKETDSRMNCNARCFDPPISPPPDCFDEAVVSGLDRLTRPFVKIQDGCDNRCAYCIVPLARGPSRSRAPDNVIEEVSQLVRAGYKEIVLTGVCLGAYGGDISFEDDEGEVEESGGGVTRQFDLLNLMAVMEQIEGLQRFRLSSMEPMDLSEGLIKFMAQSSKFCRHLHLPLQSGDDEILKRMNRPYNASQYRHLVIKLKQRIPDIGIGADVIVGFPGESEENFLNTYNLIQELPISYLHIFRFSPRKGTSACQMEDQVDEGVKKARSQALRELDRIKRRTFIMSFIGQRLPVLFENRRDKETGLLTGLTDNYIRVLADGPDELMNKGVMEVELMRPHGRKVIGRVVS